MTPAGLRVVLRFNFALDTRDPTERSRLYATALDMAAYADEQGLHGVFFDEHHGLPNGWSPAPIAAAGLFLGRTRRLEVSSMALLLTLHDPIRIAEDIAVLDLASGGRFGAVLGIGHRPAEYEQFGRSWSDRGHAMDYAIATILAAWTGEPFDQHGRRVLVTPTPATPARSLIAVAGGTKAAARRAARFDLPFAPPAHLPELAAYYREECERHGVVADCRMPAANFSHLFVSDDPERTWATIGPHLLHEAQTYASFEHQGRRSAAFTAATTVDELRRGRFYDVVTPEACRDRLASADGDVVLHPLCGGIPAETAWECLTAFVDGVWEPTRSAV